MAYKLMVCSKCFDMFRVDAARVPEEKVKCPKCGNSDVMGIYEYWKNVPAGSSGFRRGDVSG